MPEDTVPDNDFQQKSELEGYVKLPLAPRDSCPLLWWKAHEHMFPRLAKLARKYLAIPAAAVTSERAFKVAKFATKYRYRLKAANIGMALFLKYNLEALGYPSLYELSSPPSDFVQPNGVEVVRDMLQLVENTVNLD